MLDDNDRAEVARIAAETVRAILTSSPSSDAAAVRRFLATRTPGETVAAGALYEAFVAWWETEEQGDPPTGAAFGRRVMETGLARRRRGSAGRVYVVLGAATSRAA